MKLDRLTIIALVCAAFTIIVNTAAYFFLPDSIVTQITISEGRHSSTLLYLIGASLFTVTAAVMAIYSNNKKKWMAVTIVLTLINIAVLLSNLYTMRMISL